MKTINAPMDSVSITLSTYRKAQQEAMDLLVTAQAGDQYAENDLLELIRTRLMHYRVSKFLYRNRLAVPDDIKQEFMIGVALSIHQAKMDVGNPIEYILNQGSWRVRRYMRKQITGGTCQVCLECGAKSRINRVGKNLYQCRKCGSTMVDTYETSYHEDEERIHAIPDNTIASVDEALILREIFQIFEATLTPGTNVQRVYLMLKEGIRDDLNEPNYIAAIAKRMGGCSEQNIVETMKKIRSRLSQIIQEYEDGCEWMGRVAIHGRRN